jgi:hypothetical protein
MAEPEKASAGNPSSLQTAIFSPFQYSDLKVNLASGYVDDPQKGYLLQSWMHLDAKDLSILEGADGSRSISLVAACVTSDINNAIQDSSFRQCDFSIKKENISWVKEHGLTFSLSLPVKKPGQDSQKVVFRRTMMV